MDGHSRIRFGHFEADLGSHELFRDGVRVSIQEKPFLLLSALIQAPHQVISREELVQCAWADSHVEVDLCLNTAIKKVRRALNDSADYPQFIETVGNLGYRFTGRVAPLREVSSASPVQAATTPVANPPGPIRLVVLPFEDLSGSAAGSFAHGMTLHLVTRLAAHHPKQLTVIFPIRRHAGELQEMLRKFNADFAVFGSVLNDGGRIRVDVELIDQLDQGCIWAETYVRPETDYIALQDDLARHLGRSVLHALSHYAKNLQSSNAAA